MSEKKTSQAQQIPANPWQQAAEAQMARIQAFYEQLANYETEGAEKAQVAVDEMARLTKEAIDHTARMTAEWRKLSMEAIQKSAEIASRTASV